MKKPFIIVVIALILGLITFRLLSNKRKIDAGKKMPDTSTLTVAVNVAKVQPRITEKNLTLVGTVIPHQEIDMKSEVQGKIIGLYTELGDYVQKGKTLARIDDQIRQISVASAQERLADAKQNLTRYENLFKGGAATQAQYDQYKLAYSNALNGVEQSQKELSNAVISAPFSGYITKRNIEAGAFANVGTSLLSIVDVSKLKVQLSVAESDVYALHLGDPVTITTTVYPGVAFTGKLTFVSPRGDEAHNYPVEISIVNQKENELKAGTYVDIAFNKRNQTKTLQIPREALLGSIKNAQVYKLDNNNLARRQDIIIGNDNGEYLEVVNGLNEGEVIVTTGQINLTDSMRVEIIK